MKTKLAVVLFFIFALCEAQQNNTTTKDEDNSNKNIAEINKPTSQNVISNEKKNDSIARNNIMKIKQEISSKKIDINKNNIPQYKQNPSLIDKNLQQLNKNRGYNPAETHIKSSDGKVIINNPVNNGGAGSVQFQIPLSK